MTDQPDDEIEHDDDAYRGWAEQVLGELIAMGRPFTADHLRSMIPQAHQPKNHNVISSVFAHAARQGRIRSVGSTRSHRKERRGAPLTLWVSADSWVKDKHEVMQAENETLRQERDALRDEHRLLVESLRGVQRILERHQDDEHPDVKRLLAEIREVVPDVDTSDAGGEADDSGQ